MKQDPEVDFIEDEHVSCKMDGLYTVSVNNSEPIRLDNNDIKIMRVFYSPKIRQVSIQARH